MAAHVSMDGEPTHEASFCNGTGVELVMNEPWVSTPTLFVGPGTIELPNGPNYGNLVCLPWRGKLHLGFTAWMGNAYEVYRLVDLVSLEVTEIPYKEAEALGWWK